MEVKENTISPTKRYFLRINALAEKDPQLGVLKPIEKIRTIALNNDLTYDQVIAGFLDGYANRPAVGTRTYEIVKDITTGKNRRNYLANYSMISYQAFHQRIKGLAMAWRHHPHCRVQPTDFVCTIGFSSVDFAVIDFACAYARAVSVPLQSSTSGADLGEIFSNVQPVVLATTLVDLPIAVEHAIQQTSIKSVIVFNYDERVEAEKEVVEKAKKSLTTTNIQLLTLNELIDFGQQYEFSFLPKAEGDLDKMAAILHSSGSTGKPKRAVISARALCNNWLPRPSALELCLELLS